MKYILYILLFFPISAYTLFEPVDFEANINGPDALCISPAFIHAAFGISTGYIIPFGISDLATEIFTLRVPTNIGSFALRLSNFGGATYRENEISIGYGNGYKTVTFGAFVKFLYVSTESFGSNYTISSDLGLMTRMNFGIVWLSFRDITNPHIKNDAIGSMLAGGIIVSPEEWFDINVMVSKQEGFDTNTKVTGLFALSKYLTAKAGMNTSPRSFLVSIVLCFRDIGLAYTATTHQDLGLSHIISLSYSK